MFLDLCIFKSLDLWISKHLELANFWTFRIFGSLNLSVFRLSDLRIYEFIYLRMSESPGIEENFPFNSEKVNFILGSNYASPINRDCFLHSAIHLSSSVIILVTLFISPHSTISPTSQLHLARSFIKIDRRATISVALYEGKKFH